MYLHLSCIKQGGQVAGHCCRQVAVGAPDATAVDAAHLQQQPDGGPNDSNGTAASTVNTCRWQEQPSVTSDNTLFTCTCCQSFGVFQNSNHSHQYGTWVHWVGGLPHQQQLSTSCRRPTSRLVLTAHDACADQQRAWHYCRDCCHILILPLHIV
jgi:hypothetical protein